MVKRIVDGGDVAACRSVLGGVSGEQLKHAVRLAAVTLEHS